MNIPSFAPSVIRTLRAAGHEAWLVGGCVRDLLLGREPHDFDVEALALLWSVTLQVNIAQTVQHGLHLPPTLP